MYGDEFVKFAREHGWQAVVKRGRWSRPDSVILHKIEEETERVVRVSDVQEGPFFSIEEARAWISTREEGDPA